MTTEPAAGSAGLISRVKNILLTPRAEWGRIEGEEANIGQIYLGYVAILAAIAAACAVIGWSFFGIGGFGFYVRVPLMTSIISGVVNVAVMVGGVYLLGIIANALATSFGSTPNQGQAHKLMAYSFTASLLAGAFAIHPALSILGLLGLYSFALLFIGLPIMMKTPEDKKIGYFATLVVVGIVVFFVIGAITGYARVAIGGVPGISGATFGGGNRPSVQGRIETPGGGSIDLGQLEKMGEAAMSGGGGGSAAPTPAAMQGTLPQSLGPLQMVSSSASGAMGATQAEGLYQGNGAEIRLTVMHMGPMGGFASMAGAAGISESHQDANGYRRTNTVNGRVITEEMDRASGTASYSIVGRGVAITAEGRGVNADQVRAAVDAVGIERLERMSGG